MCSPVGAAIATILICENKFIDCVNPAFGYLILMHMLPPPSIPNIGSQLESHEPLIISRICTTRISSKHEFLKFV